MCTINEDHDVWFLRHKAQQHVFCFFVILGYYVPFDPSSNPKKLKFWKNEKKSGDIILHLCTTNDIIWCMLHEIWSMTIVCIGVSTPLFYSKPPPKSPNCPSTLPLFRQCPLYCFFMTPPPLKIGFFSESPMIIEFFILNSIPYFKVNKFFIKTSHFKFLVLTEKNIFAYKLVVKYFRF